MSEQNVSKAIDFLSAQAKKHESAGEYKEAAYHYKTLVSLEEICGYPKQVIESEQKNMLRCQMKYVMEKTKPYLEAMGGSQEATEVRGVSTEGTIRAKDSNDNGIDRSESSTRLIDLEKEWEQKSAKTNKQMIIFTDSPDIYPSKGCP